MTFEYHNVDAYVRSQIDRIFKSLEQEPDKTKVVDGLNKCYELLGKLKPHSQDPLEVFVDVLKYKKDTLEKIASKAITLVSGAEIEECQSVLQDIGEVAKRLEGIDYNLPDDYDEEFFEEFERRLDDIRYNRDYDPNFAKIIEKYSDIISDMVAYIKDQHDSQEEETDEAVKGALEESQEQLRFKLFDI